MSLIARWSLLTLKPKPSSATVSTEFSPGFFPRARHALEKFRVNRDYVRHAKALDARYPGSKVLDDLFRYGIDGKVLALVTGALGNCSTDLLVVVDFIATIKTARALELRTANRDQLFSMYRRFLISSFGLFTTRLWARHIHCRFRDAASSQAPSCPHQLPDPDREVTREFHLGDSHARRAQHRGSRRGA